MDRAAEWAELRPSLPWPQRFVLVNSKDDPALLKKILLHPNFPHGADVFTHELSLTGARVHPLRRKKDIEARAWKNAAQWLSLAKPFAQIARKKNLRIWLGHGLIEDGKIYNTYSLVTADGIVFTHRKKFLWRTEKWLFAKPER